MITNEYPFEFKRVQFPIKFCFSMSINETQRNTPKVTGLDITNPYFPHGHTLLLFSKIKNHDTFIKFCDENIINHFKHYIDTV